MIFVASLVFNPFQENTYIVYDHTGECIVVDAGCYSVREERALADFIASKKLKPVLAANTHGHVDHIPGVNWVKESYGVPFAIDFRDKFLLEDAPAHGRFYGFEIAATPVAEIDLGGGKAVGPFVPGTGGEFGRICFGESELQIIHVPGHTPGHVCFFDPEARILLTGDTLFKESIGRTDLPGGDYSWIMKSILERIIPLGDDVRFFSGHGPESTIGHEVLYNPFVVEVLQGEVRS